MRNVKLWLRMFILAVLSGLLLGSCGGGGGAGTATVRVAITDASDRFESVVLTIEEVGIVASQTPTTYFGRDAIERLPVTIDVLDYPAEQVFHLADIEVPMPSSGQLCFNQIRFVLAREGSDSCVGPYCNYVVEIDDPTPRSLNTPSGQQSGIKLLTPNQFCASSGETTVAVVLDFDPNVAIVHDEKNLGEYLLKPTGIRIIEGEWDIAPADFISGTVLLPIDAFEGQCLLYDTTPLITVEAAAVVDPTLPVLTTLSLAEPPQTASDLCTLQCNGDAACLADCTANLTADCYYSGPYKLLLPQSGDYDLRAGWDIFTGGVDAVTASSTGVVVMLGD